MGCLGALLVLAACNKQNADISSPPLSDYFPLQVGKYIIYRIDSTALLPFGTGFIVRSYRVKDSVDAEIRDNTGRKAYRIYRFITDTAGVQPYRYQTTVMAVPNGTDWIEYVDNNMRFMKLRWPILPTINWNGNSFFAASNSFYDGWTYQYDSIGKPYSLFGKTYDSTVKVLQRDTTYPPGPITRYTVYQQYDYSVERYAKGIGLIYKEFFHYVYQGQDTSGQSAPPHYEDESYGLRLRIIDHN